MPASSTEPPSGSRPIRVTIHGGHRPPLTPPGGLAPTLRAPLALRAAVAALRASGEACRPSAPPWGLITPQSAAHALYAALRVGFPGQGAFAAYPRRLRRLRYSTVPLTAPPLRAARAYRDRPRNDEQTPHHLAPCSGAMRMRPPAGGQVNPWAGAARPVSSAFGRRPLPSLRNQSRPGFGVNCQQLSLCYGQLLTRLRFCIIIASLPHQTCIRNARQMHHGPG